MSAQVRKAVEAVMAERGLHLNPGDLEAIVKAATKASTWVTDEQAMHLTGHSNHDSFRKWCSRYGAPREKLINRWEVERALREMVGRGFHRRTEIAEYACPECGFEGPHKVLTQSRSGVVTTVDCGNPDCSCEFEVRIDG